MVASVALAARAAAGTSVAATAVAAVTVSVSVAMTMTVVVAVVSIMIVMAGAARVLLLLAGALVAVVMLVASSTAMYHVEHGVNPAFASIPETMWWGVATLTTVGYGDVYPITPLGQMLGAVVALLGIGVFALPAGILASGFSEALERERSEIGTGSEAASGVASGYPSAASGGEGPLDGSGGAGDGKGGTCPTCGASR